MLPEDDFESETLGKYVESLRTGKTRPYMKSLPVPKTQEGPVLKVGRGGGGDPKVKTFQLSDVLFI
jgi:hypothetical protein